MSALAPLTLVLGGARSGKSAYARGLVEASGLVPVYLATAEALDAEMAERIRRHQAERDKAWTTIEEPLALAASLRQVSAPDRAVLVDCLTLWLSNLMMADAPIEARVDDLVAALPALAGPVVFVANEVGLGIVPDNLAARRFRDHAGRLNQGLAARCGRVVFMAAGLPLLLKGGT